MNDRLVQNAQEAFLKTIDDYGKDPWNLRTHIKEAEKWANKILKMYPEAVRDVVMLTVWLHDIGHYPVVEEDHAVISERISRKFFEDERTDKSLSDRVLHCVRSHRNRDVEPETLEAKLFAMIDSVSHLTYIPYIEMINDGRGESALEKLERDYRDISPFPEVKEEITPLYKALKNLIIEMSKIDLR